MPKLTTEMGGDAMRVAIATPATLHKPTTQSQQPTLDGIFGTPPSAPRADKRRQKKIKHGPPVAFCTYPVEPSTPPRSKQKHKATEDKVLSPARHLRENILSSSAAPDGAIIDAGTPASPYRMRKPGSPAFLARIIDLRIEGEGKENGRIMFFGHTPNAESYTPLPKSELEWEDKDFKSFQRKNRLTDVAINTSDTLEITLKSIQYNEGKPRLVKQDDVMQHTANSHMRDRLPAIKGKKNEYFWGHRFAHTLKAETPTPEDLEVVGSAANTYESVMTAGLKKAIQSFALTRSLGHWELTINSHRIKVINKKTQEIAYLPHVSYKQEYSYVYVDETSKRSKPLVFVIHPLDPNEVSYQESTNIFKDIFFAVMQGKSFFRSRQRTLNFQQEEATDPGPMDTELEEALPAEIIPKITTSEESEEMDVSEDLKPFAAEKPSPDERKQQRKRKTNIDHTPKVIPFLKMNPDELISLVAQQAIISNSSIFLTPNQENNGKDDILILPQGSCPPETLATIEDAQSVFKKSRISRENCQKKPESQKLPSITKDIRQAFSSKTLAGLELETIRGDGHCFYNAVGLYLGKDFKELRQEVADYMKEHIDELIEFWKGDIESFEKHIKDVRSNSEEWADHLEIEALQRLTGRPVIIIKPNAHPTMPENIRDYAKPPIFVFYNNKYNEGDAHYDALIVEDGYTAESILETLLQSIEAGCLITHPGKTAVKRPQPNLMAFFTQNSGAAAETPGGLMTKVSHQEKHSTSQGKHLSYTN